MSATNPFQPATRAQLKARVAFAGPTGSGKTWTSLEWAKILAGGGKVAVVDTERGSASLYSDHFDFDVMAFDPPYDPQRLTDILKAAEANGYAAVVIDSMSHFWEGEGGTRDIADAAAARSGGNSFAGWKDATPKLRHLIDVMLGLDAHVIATMRSKMEYVIEQNARGKQAPRKVGLAPVMRAGIEYEFTLVGDIDLDHRIAITKSRCDRLADELVLPGRAGEAAELFMSWLGEGEPLATRADIDALVARMAALSDGENRKACKKEFVAEFGAPHGLRAAQVEAAEALVARFEAAELSDSIPVEPTTPTASAHGAGGGDDKGTDDGTREGVGETPTAPEVSGGGDAAPSTTQATAPGVRTGGGDGRLPEADEPARAPSGVSPEPGGEPPTVTPPPLDVDAVEQTAAATAAPAGPDTPTPTVLLAATGKTAGAAVVALKRAAAEVNPSGPFMADEICQDPEFATKVLAHLGGMPVEGEPKSTYTAKQNGWIHAVWANHGGDNARKAYLSQLTSGRTDSSSELTAAEKKAYLAKTEELG